MRRELLMGAAAGAVGTAALNVVTYLDMAVRGRPASSVPAEAAGNLASQVGLDFGADGQDGEVVQNRKQGLGALLGYVTGVGTGLVYGGVRSRMRQVPQSTAAVVLGLAAMAGTDTPIVSMGLTDPREWDVTSWASDVVPHLAYGLATAVAYDAFTKGDLPPRRVGTQRLRTSRAGPACRPRRTRRGRQPDVRRP